ncbi:MAG: hypothetical protein EOM64_01185 [Erysipelotrichia bacterium]|nr:hypothetical protein [Erysipelotrichia bacterium]
MLKQWDYEKSILQVSASLRQYYGLTAEYKSDKTVDEWLDCHHFRCIIALLIDGMGSEIIHHKLMEEDFFRTYQSETVSTVYPPTTTAATTAFQTGKSPKTNAWLGWNQYFSELDDQVILFRNQSQYGDQRYPKFSWKTLPVLPIQDELNNRGIKADSVWPGWSEHNPCITYQALLDKLDVLSKDNDLRFVYAYWDRLDEMMHELGPSDVRVGQELKRLDQLTAAFAEKLNEDIGILILADHGQIDVTHYALDQDEELCGCFRKAPSLEARTTAFFIKPECMELFPVLFNRKFSGQFELLSHDETVQSGIFGPGAAHPRFEEFIGDYTAFAKSDLQLDYIKGKHLKGNHAGLLDAESMIPVILYPKNAV